MAWSIEISPLAEKQLSKLDRSISKRIFNFLYTRIETLDDPRTIGEALTGSRLGEFWKYRVGDYRIICEIQDKQMVVVALQIGHRRHIYRQ